MVVWIEIQSRDCLNAREELLSLRHRNQITSRWNRSQRLHLCYKAPDIIPHVIR